MQMCDVGRNAVSNLVKPWKESSQADEVDFNITSYFFIFLDFSFCSQENERTDVFFLIKTQEKPGLMKCFFSPLVKPYLMYFDILR